MYIYRDVYLSSTQLHIYISNECNLPINLYDKETAMRYSIYSLFIKTLSNKTISFI